MKTGDDSRIPADLQRVTFSTVCLRSPGYPELLIETGLQVVRHGGRAEYNAIVAIHDKPPTPTARVAAMHVSVCLFNRGYF